jgi:hypothetical protein
VTFGQYLLSITNRDEESLNPNKSNLCIHAAPKCPDTIETPTQEPMNVHVTQQHLLAYLQQILIQFVQFQFSLLTIATQTLQV